MKNINLYLNITINQLLVIVFLAIIFIVLVVAIISLFKGIVKRKEISDEVLPDIDGLDEDVKEDEPEDDSSFFDLDAVDEDYSEDMASYYILQEAKRAERPSAAKFNPFKKNKK